jgi:hypothetical protein
MTAAHTRDSRRRGGATIEALTLPAGAIGRDPRQEGGAIDLAMPMRASGETAVQWILLPKRVNS